MAVIPDHATWVRFPRFVGDDGAPSAIASQRLHLREERAGGQRRALSVRWRRGGADTARGAVRSGGSPQRRAPLELPK